MRVGCSLGRAKNWDTHSLAQELEFLVQLHSINAAKGSLLAVLQDSREHLLIIGSWQKTSTEAGKHDSVGG